MASKGQIDARKSFINILSSTEKKFKSDYMLKYLINKTKEDFKKQVIYASSKNLYFDTDIYSPNLRKNLKYKTNNSKISKLKSMQLNQQNFGKKSFSIWNIKTLNKDIKIKLDGKKLNLDEKVEEESDKEKDKDNDKEELKIFNIENSTERKKYDKLENLNSILKLIDVHEKTQFQIVDENIQKRLNMQRNKKKLALFRPSVTYNKNNLIYNKKYKLIFDKDNSINNLYIHTHPNKKRNNLYLNNITSNKNNINSLSSETRSNYTNFPLSTSNRIQSPIGIIPIKNKLKSTVKIIPVNKNKKQNQRSATETSVTKYFL